MLPASDLFMATLRTSHQRVLRLHLYGATMSGADLDYGELQVVSGSLDMDITSFVSTTLRATIASDPFGTLGEFVAGEPTTAVLFSDPCNSLAAWTSTSFASIVPLGHTGTGLQIGGAGGARWTIPTAQRSDKLNASFWWRTSNAGVAHDICAWRTGASVNQLKLVSTALGALQLQGGGSPIGTTPNFTVTNNTWYFIEVTNVRIADSPDGTATLRVNGVDLLTLTGVDTSVGTTSSYILNEWAISTTGSGTTQTFDDITLSSLGPPVNETNVIENGYVTVEVGLVFPHDPEHPEFIKLATLRLTRYTPSTSLATTNIEATDRTIMLRDYPVTNLEMDEGGYQANLDAGWNWTAAVQALVSEAMIGEVVTVDAGVPSGNLDKTLSMLNTGRDQLISAWADAHSAWMRCDANGALHLSPKPVPGDPAWEVQHGANGVLVQNDEEYARDLVYNAVWVQWQQPDQPPADAYISQAALDLDPSSRTYWNGPFGRRMKVIDDVPVHNDAEALALATAHLNEILGRYFTISVTALTNPLLQLGDTISVEAFNFPPHLRVVEGLTIPLGPDATMEIRTRTATS